jgi:hypothetical protein
MTSGAAARPFRTALSLTTAKPPAGKVRPRNINGPSAQALGFTAAILCVTLLLQRFGLPLGSKSFSLVGPIAIAIAVRALARGALAVNKFRLVAYLALAICVVAGLTWHSLTPGGDVGVGANLASMSQFLLLSSFAVLTFSEPVDEKQFFGKVTLWFAAIAIAGILQFCAQFIGVELFAFTGILPNSILVEAGYNLQIPIGVGSLLKSNGFFLIEPSTFSQVMTMGLIIEILAFKRVAYLALFIAGLLLSFSGTGWIVLGSFIIAAGLAMGWRGIAIAGATIILLTALLGAGAYLLPDMAAAMQDRFTEIYRPGTSGHLRFITPFWALDDMLTERPSAALVGLGAGVSERLNLSYEYDVNTPIKISLDYGFPALLAYVLLFVGGRKSPIQSAILAPSCILFFFTGGYQQFPPVLFLILLLISVARLRPSPDDLAITQSLPRISSR